MSASIPARDMCHGFKNDNLVCSLGLRSRQRANVQLPNVAGFHPCSLNFDAATARLAGTGQRIKREVTMADDPAAYLSAIPEGPPDGILGIAQNFKACTAANKVNLVIGAYRTEEGEPWVLPSVKAAEQRLIDRNENKEYATQAGVPAFVEHALRFAYGDASEPLKSGCIAAVQVRVRVRVRVGEVWGRVRG